MSQATDWDAATYHRVADPQFRWGTRLLERLELHGDETVIDAGCGTGRLTRLLLDRVPRGKVIGIDVSPQMAQQARGYLEPEFGDRVQIVCRDLLALNLDQVADVVFSTATFHWIPDQDRLFRNIARALRPGGRLLAQMGGKGNLHRALARAEAIEQAPQYRAYFEGWDRPNVYPDEEETRQGLEQAGFDHIDLELFPEPTSFKDAGSFAEFIKTVILRLNLRRLPDESLRKEFVDRLVEQAALDDPPFTLDYWRLNMSAWRN